jgi:ADP-ribose pyrophosphatase
MVTVYKGRVFSVEVERLKFPDGREHEVAIVRHPASVVILPMHSRPCSADSTVSTGDRAELWELPAGSRNPGERVAQAAARECEGNRITAWSAVRVRGLFPPPASAMRN